MAQAFAPDPMPDDKPPANEPTPLPESLLREAETEVAIIVERARMMAETLRCWADPSRAPAFVLAHRYDPLPAPADMATALDEAAGFVSALRRARAVLEGISPKAAGEEDVRRDERALVRLVEDTEAETVHIKRDDPDPLHTLGLIVDAVLYDFALRFSRKTWIHLHEPRSRVLLVQAVAIKTKRRRAESPSVQDERPTWPRWLEPLHEIAKLAELPGGKATVATWYRQLRDLDIVGKKA